MPVDRYDMVNIIYAFHGKSYRLVSNYMYVDLPWLMMVDSNATTGRPLFRAVKTSGAMFSMSDRVLERFIL